MAEGRIQYLTHHTEDAVWQKKRWLTSSQRRERIDRRHRVVADVDEAAGRYARFIGEIPCGPLWDAASSSIAVGCSFGSGRVHAIGAEPAYSKSALHRRVWAARRFPDQDRKFASRQWRDIRAAGKDGVRTFPACARARRLDFRRAECRLAVARQVVNGAARDAIHGPE